MENCSILIGGNLNNSMWCLQLKTGPDLMFFSIGIEMDIKSMFFVQMFRSYMQKMSVTAGEYEALYRNSFDINDLKMTKLTVQ